MGALPFPLSLDKSLGMGSSALETNTAKNNLGPF